MTPTLLSSSNGVKKNGFGPGYHGMHMAEIITNGFFRVDRKWTVSYWNRAAEKILGVAARNIVGKNIWEVLETSIPAEFCNTWRNALLEDIPGHIEEYWPQMGSWFDVIAYVHDDTLSISFKSYSHPVHSRHPDHPEQQLKIINELYRVVTELSNDCLWEWDLRNHEMFWIDGGHERVFGYQIENALVHQSFWESLIHRDDKQRVLQKLAEIILDNSGENWEIEYRFKKADGTYACVLERGHIFYDENGQASTMIGSTQDITARKMADRQLAEEKIIKQKEITDAVIHAHEDERTTIGKELHDNLNQILGAAKLYIEMAKTDEQNREMCLEKSSSYIVRVIEEIRKISKHLAAPSMHLMGLIESINSLIDDLLIIHPIKIEFHAEGVFDNELTEKLQLDIFRIVQEQVNNILKHANATRTTIDLTRQGNEIVLIISDNGKGCDPAIEKMGVGLINIRSRAEANHGGVMIVSRPGVGYTLQVSLDAKQKL